MKVLFSLTGLVLLAPCFSACDVPPWTTESAKKRGKSVFAEFLQSQQLKRSDFENSVVGLDEGFAAVGFRERGREREGYTVVLGPDGCSSTTVGFDPSLYPSRPTR